MKLRKLNNENIFDFTIRAYGDISYVNKVIELNNLTSLSDFDNIGIGNNVDISGIYYGEKETIFYEYTTNNDYQRYDRKKVNQNLIDFVLSNYGSLDGLSDFIISNNFDQLGKIGGAYNYETSDINTLFIVNKTETPFTDSLRFNNTYIATDNKGASTKYGDFNIDFNIDFY